ncbi:MAG TPA: AraC family ligand binding domain-containing protein [Gammaproteobacteria bacterium]|nr:AraC family ligand binding domain-containing protein [Gammaproteobacteria bacterium]
MRTIVLCVAALAIAFVIGRLSAQDVQPSCLLCPSTHIPASEFAEYERIGRASGVTDQQVRSVDIGKTNVQVALIHRGKLDAPAPRSVAAHDLVSEVYYIISGSGTNVTGPEMAGQERRPATDRAVRLLNGPGSNAAEIRNGSAHELKQGDVLVIPAGTGHQFTKIDDHITYLMIRIDPDKVVPLMDEAASRAYLDENGN